MAQSSNQEKAKLRARCRMLRDDMGESARLTASASICKRIAEWSDFPTSGVVFTYLPMRGEVDLRPLIAAIPDVRWAIPRVEEQPDSHLIFHLYDPDHLIRHRYGMLEPDPSLPVVEPEQADLDPRPRTGLHAGAAIAWAMGVGSTTACCQRRATSGRSAPASRRCCSTRSRTRVMTFLSTSW